MSIFRCWQCDKRLNIDPYQAKVHVIVICPRCKARNPISTKVLTS